MLSLAVCITSELELGAQIFRAFCATPAEHPACTPVYEQRGSMAFTDEGSGQYI